MSEQPTAAALPDWDPFVDLEGALNFRDLGGRQTVDGRTVRRSRVYRSDALHLVTRRDVDRLKHEVGLDHIIDLRASAELDAEGRGPLGRERIHFHHIPLWDTDARARGYVYGEARLAERYAVLADIAMPAVARVVHTLATIDTPAVFHCAAGKDRTGVVAAILLALLDVADAGIIADYAMTERRLDAILARLRQHEGYQIMLDSQPPDTMFAKPETMADFLTVMRTRYGTFRGYATAAGIAEPTLDRLRRRLLVDA